MITNLFIAIVFVITPIVGYSVANMPKTEVMAQEIAPTTATKPLETIETPETYITKVFGEYAPKAFQLLQDPKCHENLKLDPLAVNDNRTWGGKGRDRGIFQISDYYHPAMTDEMVFDFKQNIDYAWRMFRADNFTFKRWTCGRFLSI